MYARQNLRVAQDQLIRCRLADLAGQRQARDRPDDFLSSRHGLLLINNDISRHFHFLFLRQFS